ncbi:MAG: Crp/Fnr family transcriptional regulator [Rhodospirillales bacterium]|nr:Crp/Fnr family transcriptional regulator [Rhodospirillales bacterium]
MIAIMSETIIQHLRDLPGTERVFDEGKFLFHQGDTVAVLHEILDGSVSLARHQVDGALVVTQRAITGSILAMPSLFADVYHCDAIADLPTRTRSVAKPALYARLIERPRLAAAWHERLASAFHNALQRAEILSLKTVAARLDAWIAAHEGKLPPKGEWKTIADEIGTSPEALYRELAKRRKD